MALPGTISNYIKDYYLMNQTIECVPAYGRDYNSQAAVREDWEANLDFQIVSVADYGRYINKQDADLGGLSVLIRYAKLQKVMAFTN